MWLCSAVLVTEVRSKLRACCRSHKPDWTSWACSNALSKKVKKARVEGSHYGGDTEQRKQVILFNKKLTRLHINRQQISMNVFYIL